MVVAAHEVDGPGVDGGLEVLLFGVDPDCAVLLDGLLTDFVDGVEEGIWDWGFVGKCFCDGGTGASESDFWLGMWQILRREETYLRAM